ncbi:hypothetical protein ABTY35_24540 [Streptomyces fimicarius]|uniref:hypothetical protein n=1 Tax=Streptomyces griseus TaxID=1911 RepID=UPI000A36BF8C|nr:hypothetical protein [Streptomyces fimicarius]
MTAVLPFLARIPLLVWALLAIALLYLLLIALLSLTAVYGKKLARRRAAADMVRILWFAGGRQDEQAPDPDPRS